MPRGQTETGKAPAHGTVPQLQTREYPSPGRSGKDAAAVNPEITQDGGAAFLTHRLGLGRSRIVDLRGLREFYSPIRVHWNLALLQYMPNAHAGRPSLLLGDSAGRAEFGRTTGPRDS